MPLNLPEVQHVHREAFVTDMEIERHPNWVGAHVREQLRAALIDAILDARLTHQAVPGGMRYTLDVLVLNPAELMGLVQAEARRLVKQLGYADA